MIESKTLNLLPFSMSIELSTEVKQTIIRIPWGELSHAYGVASDAPQELENLFSDEEVKSSNAYYDWLLSAVFHQYTLYSATYGTIRVVIAMLKTMNVSELEIDEQRADRLLLDWLYICAESSNSYPDVQKELLDGKFMYRKFTDSEDVKVSELATALVNWCLENGNS